MWLVSDFVLEDDVTLSLVAGFASTSDLVTILGCGFTIGVIDEVDDVEDATSLFRPNKRCILLFKTLPTRVRRPEDSFSS